jgi:polysaccharide pyruvyl transferase WcaK-like protein
VFDGGWGQRPASTTVDGRPFPYLLCGMRDSRRYHRPESIFNIRVSARLGGLRNPAARTIQRADLLLAANGGDGFTDLYSRARFKTITASQEVVLKQRRPLLLLPQTYGPFSTPSSRKRAAGIVRATCAAWARDPDSFEVLQDLLGDDFDPARHRLGIDMAFALEPAPVERRDAAELVESNGLLAGVNISGLVFNEIAGEGKFGFRLDYRATVLEIVKRLIADGARVLLVPHVHSSGDERHSDRRSARELIAQLDAVERERVALIPSGLNAGETKWIISRCDWFCGTRMHSAIAGLSTGVPTAAIAYSAKTAGVFDLCGQRDRVVDARTESTEQASDQLWRSWSERDRTRAELAISSPESVRRAKTQWDEILNSALAGP